MKVLVTGCAGFIGWRVADLLLRKGNTVVGIDSLDNGYDVRLKHWRLAELKTFNDFSYHCLDITNPAALQSVYKGSVEPEPVDAVINLAARAGIRSSVEQPQIYYETNVTGTLNILELCRENGIEKFVLASTSSVYGNGESPFRETGPTDHPLSPYASSKKAAESLCYVYHHLYGLDVTILRYFTVYGPGGRPDMSVFRFVKWIEEGEPLTLFGDGSQKRDFTYVDDIARGTVAALKPIAYQVINLGSDRPMSLRNVIEIIEDILGKKAQIDPHPAQPADVKVTWADISKAQELLHWTPSTTLEQGLGQAVQWYKENRNWAKDVLV